MEDLVIPTNGLELVATDPDPPNTVIEGVQCEETWPVVAPNIEILANDVTIHGFTIRGPDCATDWYSSGIVIDGENVEIYDNVFDVTVADNANEISQAIQTYRDANATTNLDGLHIHDNTFDGGGASGYEGIFINHVLSDPDPTGTVTIENNDFNGPIARAITTERSNVVINLNTINTTLDPWNGSVGAMQGIWCWTSAVATRRT